MLLKLVNFVVLECLVFVLVAIGAFVLSHLGLLLVGRVDAILWRDGGSRATKDTKGNDQSIALSAKRN